MRTQEKKDDFITVMQDLLLEVRSIKQTLREDLTEFNRIHKRHFLY